VQNRKLEHQSGELVHGAVIRDAITPTGGKVVKTCEKETARDWALMLHELTSAPSSRDVQVAFGVKHLCNRVRTRKLRVVEHHRRGTFQQAVYGSADIETIKLTDLGDHLDLALCVLHSYTVNAPAVAFELLTEALNERDIEKEPERFATMLLAKIKAKKYGFWDKRWERTRKAAIEVGWWDGALFKRPAGIMTP
jgi:hypothetical protein